MGARALILSPTRELATQTMKFTKEVRMDSLTAVVQYSHTSLYLQLGRFTDLRPTLVLGGDKMDDQFLALHRNPDM